MLLNSNMHDLKFKHISTICIYKIENQFFK